jgi:hypothetical protein
MINMHKIELPIYSEPRLGPLTPKIQGVLESSNLPTKRRLRTKETGKLPGEVVVAEVCFHLDVVDLECSACGAEFNEPALAEVIDGWERRNSVVLPRPKTS